MSLAAVPAYFLARRMLGPGLSLLAALLAVAVPSMVYTSTVMTENAFYPLFLTVSLALVITLERPTPARQLGLIALCLVAFLTRVQAVALAPALVTAPLLLGLFAGRPLRTTLATYRVLLGTIVGGGAFVALLQLARGHSLAELLGAYSVVGEASYSLGNVARFFLYHVEELDLYVGVVPLAALAVLTAGARRAPRAVQAYLAAALSLSFFLVLAVAVFASRFADRIQERNMFPVAALLLIALLVWVGRGAARPPWTTAVALSAAALLPALIPFRRFIATSAISDTLMLLPWWSLHERSVSLDYLWVAVLALGIALCDPLRVCAAPFRGRTAARHALLLRGHVAADPGWRPGDPAGGCRRALHRHHCVAHRTGSTVRSLRERTWRCSTRDGRTASPSTRTSSSTAASGRVYYLTTPTSRRPAGDEGGDRRARRRRPARGRARALRPRYLLVDGSGRARGRAGRPRRAQAG